MSRTSKQYPLTRFTTSGELTLERCSILEHALCYKRVPLGTWRSRGAALLKVLLLRDKWLELYREAKRERVVDYLVPELINMVHLKQNRLICCKNEFINLKCCWGREAPSGKGLWALHYKQEAVCYACGC